MILQPHISVVHFIVIIAVFYYIILNVHEPDMYVYLIKVYIYILECVPSTSNVNMSVPFAVIHIKLAMRAWMDLTISDYISF